MTAVFGLFKFSSLKDYTAGALGYRGESKLLKPGLAHSLPAGAMVSYWG